MSTWDVPCYKSDTLSAFTRVMPKEDHYARASWNNFGYEITTLEGLDIKSIEDLKTYKGLNKLLPNTSDRPDVWLFHELLYRATAAGKPHFGLTAVYKIVDAFLNGKIAYNTEVDFPTVEKYTYEISKLDFFASYMTPRRIEDTIKQGLLDTKTNALYKTCMQASYTLTHLAYYHRAASYRDKTYRCKKQDRTYPHVPKDDIDLGKYHHGYSFNGITMIQEIDIDGRPETTYVFNNKSIQRAAQMLRSIGKMVQYYSMQSKRIGRSDYLTTAISMIFEMISYAAKTDRPNEVCRAFDVIYFTALAEHATDINNRSIKLQREKYAENKYDDIAPINWFLSASRKFKIYEQLDLLKLYKMFPCPDFDPHTGFLNMKKYHYNQNKVGTITEAYKRHKLNIDLQSFEHYRLMLYAQRFYRRHGRCPGRLTQQGRNMVTPQNFPHLISYPHIDAFTLKIEDIPLIDMKGTAMWENVDNNCAEYYMDKACPPQDFDLDKIKDGMDYNKLRIDQRSYLGWYLAQTDVPPGMGLRFSYAKHIRKAYQTAHFKPESKKPDPRNFYSAPPYIRRILSEYELNVRHYVEHDVAAILGKDPHDLNVQMNRVLGGTLDRSTHRWILVSFDIEKWSPKMPKEIKELTYGFWNKLFDQPYLSATQEIFNEVDLHFIHEGVHQKYTVNNVDFEGQSGVVNTAFHTDMMAFAVRQCRQKGLITESGRLAVMIDDGLLALPFPLNTTNERINDTLDIIEAVYNYFGFTISWDKTFISEHVAMFLNEVYYDGLNVTTGVKAFLKMQPTKLDDELSFSGKIKGLTGMAMGCISSGLPPTLAKIELHREVMIMLQRTLRGKHAFKTIGSAMIPYFTFTPIAFGGLGIPFLNNISGSPNADPVGNFIGSAYYIVQTQIQVKGLLERILKQDLRVRRPVDILRAPAAVRVMGKTLTEMKHIQYVLTMVKSLCQNSYLRPLLHVDFESLGQQILSQLGPNPTETEVDIAYRMSPISIIDKFMSKFKRSSTMMSLLAPRMRARLVSRYLLEVNSVYNQFVDRMGTQ